MAYLKSFANVAPRVVAFLIDLLGILLTLEGLDGTIRNVAAGQSALLWHCLFVFGLAIAFRDDREQ